ncbi:hypothetical protein BGZ83_008557 [Gryganskiella cystojenkinii]|nr:hypothetical protein BGZ83_008557 [Gryganskiella cystojenkinii]
MVYATRSRVVTPDTPAIFSGRSSAIKKTTHSKRVIKSVMPSALKKKMVIDPEDAHSRHIRDGKDHHVVENDGLNHHHIWYKDFAGSDAMDLELAPGPQPRSQKSSKTSAAENNYGPSHAGHTPRKHALDGFEDHIQSSLSSRAKIGLAKVAKKVAEATANLTSTRSRNEADANILGYDLRDGHHGGSDHTLKAPANSITTKRTSPSSTKKTTLSHGVAHTVTTKSVTPMRQIVEVHLDGRNATTHHYQGSNSTMTTTTTTTANKALQKDQHQRLAQDEVATRILTQKSQLDRQKARDAILSLDNDVLLLQKLLQEKEEALRAAEARTSEFQQVTIRTETLTREIHDLEITIRDLRTNLHSKDKVLKETQQQLKQDRHHGQEQQHLLQLEISKLNKNLKAKEHVQEYSQRIQSDLDKANKQHARHIVEIRETKEALKGREADLKNAHSTTQGLERSNHKQYEVISRLGNEVEVMRKSMAERERELKDCHSKMKVLEGSQQKVHTLGLQIQNLRDQLADSERQCHELEKTNKTLAKDSSRLEKLADNVRILKDDIKDREIQLGKALKSIKEFEIYKDQAESLEEELEELRDQVIVQEKHLTYLEHALEAHDNCAGHALKLQDQIDILKNVIHEKETMIVALEEANLGLSQKDDRIQTLQAEVKTILHEMEAKERAAQKLKQKADHDLAKVSSTANVLRTEVEGLRQELVDKIQLLKSAQKDGVALDAEKEKNMTLTVEITRLEKIVAEKDRQVTDLEKVAASMRHHSDRADQLELQVKKLEKDARQARQEADRAAVDLATTSSTVADLVIEVDTLHEKLDLSEKESYHSKKAADQTAKDLVAASSTASQLVVEVESLREQYDLKERQLAHANKNAKDLERKAAQVQDLLAKITDLEESSRLHIARALKAEDRAKALEEDIQSTEARVSSLQHQLHTKEIDLGASLEKASKDQKATSQHLEEMRGVVADLKKQLKEAEKETRQQIKSKEDEIKKLRGEIQDWENHEEGWVIKTTDLTLELERGTDVIRHKDKALHDLRHKLGDQNVEIGRLNEVINHARGELIEDRKRRASEIEDRVREHTQHHQKDKSQLKDKIIELEGEIKHMEKKIRLDHDHEVKEQELAERIRELNYWKQNATEQTKEWETTVAHLEKEKETQIALLTRYEQQIQMLRSQVEESDVWRQKAIEQAEELTGMIVKLEKELSVLRGTLARHDANDAKQTERIRTLHAQIESLEVARDDVQREIRAKETLIGDLEGRLRDEINSYKARFADARKDLAAKDRKIEALNARITEYTRHNADLEMHVAKDKESLIQLESTLDKLRHSLASQMEKYKNLDSKYQSTLVIQADQDKQLYQLEKKVARISAEDSEKQKHLRSQNRHLEKELDQALGKVEELQVEIHNVTRKYHEILKQLENANIKMAKMVPAEKASHDACAARVQAGEKEVSKLSGRIENMRVTIDELNADITVREQQWNAAEADYKSRISNLTKNQRSLETELRKTEKQRDQERQGREHDRLQAEKEIRKNEDMIQSLRHQSQRMQKEFTTMETRMRREMSTTKDLAELLGKLRQSIKRDSEAELRSLDELEKELKSRESVVEETIQITRNRMDSGAFLESTAH